MEPLPKTWRCKIPDHIINIFDSSDATCRAERAQREHLNVQDLSVYYYQSLLWLVRFALREPKAAFPNKSSALSTLQALITSHDLVHSETPQSPVIAVNGCSHKAGVLPHEYDFRCSSTKSEYSISRAPVAVTSPVGRDTLTNVIAEMDRRLNNLSLQSSTAASAPVAPELYWNGRADDLPDLGVSVSDAFKSDAGIGDPALDYWYRTVTFEYTAQGLSSRALFLANVMIDLRRVDPAATQYVLTALPRSAWSTVCALIVRATGLPITPARKLVSAGADWVWTRASTVSADSLLSTDINSAGVYCVQGAIRFTLSLPVPQGHSHLSYPNSEWAMGARIQRIDSANKAGAVLVPTTVSRRHTPHGNPADRL